MGFLDRLRGGGDEARSIAFAAIAGERELADQENLTVDILHRAVHLVLLITKNAQSRQLPRHPLGVSFRIAPLNAEQDAKAGVDLGAVLLCCHNDGCI